MSKNIKVEIRNDFGSRRIVPLDDTGKVMAKIAGTKTLTPETVELVKILGYTFEVHNVKI